jgi:hypothetical protein
MDFPDQTSPAQLLRLDNDIEPHYASHVKVEESAYDSPYGSAAGTPFSNFEDDNSLMPPPDPKADGNEENALDKEQPYAQLIYRALLEAPDHTMVLRDIYNWFKQNTDKAADKETKGWQNSIRHNLSMNGVCHFYSTLWIELIVLGFRKGRSTMRGYKKRVHVETHRRSHPRRCQVDYTLSKQAAQ